METVCHPESHPASALRLAILASYEIVGSSRETTFDDIAKLASDICGAPLAAISLVTDTRQWFKAEIGVGVRETPVEHSVCSVAMRQPDVFIIPDMSIDPVFKAHPWVHERHIRFYAGAPLITPEGFALGAVCVLDVVPRTLTEAQKLALGMLARQVIMQLTLRRALMLSDRLNTQLTRKMVTAGHDLKQPLQIAIMNLELLKGKDRQGTHARIDASIKALFDLSEGLDILAAESAATLRPGGADMARISLNDLLRSLQNAWQMHADDKHVQLTVVPSSMHVKTDLSLISSVIGNLLGNAIKYTRPAGRVVLGARRGHQFAEVQIADNGMGFDREKLALFYKPFVQGDSKSPGMGLGLAIVKDAVELLGHRLSVKSKPGAGTVFSICIPLAED